MRIRLMPAMGHPGVVAFVAIAALILTAESVVLAVANPFTSAPTPVTVTVTVTRPTPPPPPGPGIVWPGDQV